MAVLAITRVLASAAVQGPEGLQGLKPQHDVGFARGNQGALQLSQHHGGDHNAAPLSHAVGLAHHGVVPGHQGRLPQQAAGQQRPLAPHPGEEDAEVGFGFLVFGFSALLNLVIIGRPVAAMQACRHAHLTL